MFLSEIHHEFFISSEGLLYSVSANGMLSFCFSSHLCSIPCRSARVTEAYIVVAHLARSTYPGTAAFTESQQFGQANKVTKMQLVRDRHGYIQGSFINLQQDIDRRTRKESILLSNLKGFLNYLVGPKIL